MVPLVCICPRFRGPVVDIIDWFESPWTVLRPVGGHPMRVEDYVQDGYYQVRAELPGIDPEKDIELTVRARASPLRSPVRVRTGRGTGAGQGPWALSSRGTAT